MDIQTSGGRATVELDGQGVARFLFVLTHGAGGGVTAPDLLAARDAGLRLGGRVARVLQPYRVRGARAPGSVVKQDAEWLEVVAALREIVPGVPLIQGGRSNGARVACRTAVAAGATAVVALAFPLHPPGKPENSRRAELREPRDGGIPVLVVNGERDPFGVPDAKDADQVVAVLGETHALRGHTADIAAAVTQWLTAALGALACSGASRGPLAQAAGAWPAGFQGATSLTGRSSARSVGRCGAIRAPSGSSSPVSSKITMPLQSKLHPCSG
jgi:predicted alpha/beta-hydrolase family hydrolase